MTRVTWELRDYDQEFFARELDDFVPDRVYDVHAHLYRATDWQGQAPLTVLAGPAEITLEVYREQMEWILPGREVHGMHFPFPGGMPGGFPTEEPNAWVAQEIARDPLARGQFMVRPTDDPEWVRQEVHRLGMRGLKPFASYADVPDYSQAELPTYLPEELVAVAHEEGWSITLHMQRTLSAADPSNQHWFRYYCEKYPHITLILDHAARGFNPYLAWKGLPALAGLDNLYVDTSVCCAPLAIMACLKYLGPDHVMWASDYLCSHHRGTNFGVNQALYWMDEGEGFWQDQKEVDKVQPTLVGLENLRAAKAAYHMMGMGDREIEAYFWGNAARVLSL